MRSKPYIPVISMQGQTGIHDIFERCYPDEYETWSDRAVEIMQVWLKYNSDHPDAPGLVTLLAKREQHVKR